MKALRRTIAILFVLALAGLLGLVLGEQHGVEMRYRCYVGSDRDGCRDQRSLLQNYVKSSMQMEFETDAYLKQWRLTVTQVVVLKRSDHQFDGLATVVQDGMPHTVPVEITVDGDHMMWQVRPGGFGFVAQKELRRLQADFEETTRNTQ